MKFTVGGDPEMMLVNPKGHIISSLDVFPQHNKNNKIDFGGGYSTYPDNVLMEGTLPPANGQEEMLEHYRSLFRLAHGALQGNHLRAQASHVFTPDQLTHEGALTVGCNPEFCAWQVEQYSPTLVDGLRTSGAHIHLGAEMLLEPQNVLDCIKLMDIFVGVPVSILDCDPTGQARKALYGKMGRFRPRPYGAEYRTLSNFWLHSPNTAKLVYDLTAHVVDIVEAGDAEKYLAYTSEEELREALDRGNKALAREVMLRIFPNNLLSKINSVELQWGASLNHNWGI